jgi:hypothetical protein
MASKQAYAAACIELFSRLWAELEAVYCSDVSTARAKSLRTSATRLEILRLDLIVSIDACDSMRWRSQLDTPQRLFLKVVLVEVLHALDAPVDEIPSRSIAQAQNRLLDAVLDHYRPLNETAGRPMRRTAAS